MLHKDYTTQLLGIANVSVDKIEKKDDATYIFLSTEKAQQICPSCANTVLHIHDYRMQKIKDLSFHGKPCYLILRKRRYVCKHCGKRFSEKYAFLPRYCHFTQRVYLSILNSMSKTMSCKNIAAVHNVSPATVMRIFALCAYPTRPQLPEVLGIDEFKGNTGGEKYNCILTDIARREVVNILPSRKKEQMREYFRRYSRAEREKVKVFVCDMWKDYRDISLLFQNAVLVTDKRILYGSAAVR